MEDLSQRQKSILNFIQQEIKNRGYPPSVREIGSAVGLKSPASVHSHLKTLEEFKYIRRDPSKPRAIEVLFDQNGKEKYDKELLHIPLVGKVTAGAPILAEENIEDYFPVPIDYMRKTNKELFMLEIKGDSMINAGIHNRDFVIAQKQNYADQGNIVIALIDDEATVKRFYKEVDHIRLQPENPTMEPLRLSNVVILGKVIGLFRKIIE